MNRRIVFVGLMVIVAGLIITLISFLYERNLSLPGMSKISHGLPLGWYIKTQIVYPGTPVVTTVLWLELVLDILFWSMIAAIPTASIILWKEKTKSDQPG